MDNFWERRCAFLCRLNFLNSDENQKIEFFCSIFGPDECVNGTRIAPIEFWPWHQ